MRLREGIAYAEQLKHPYLIAMANSLFLYLCFICREPDSTLARAEAELKISMEQSFPYTESLARIAIAWARAEKSPDKGLLELTAALEHYRTQQTRV